MAEDNRAHVINKIGDMIDCTQEVLIDPSLPSGDPELCFGDFREISEELQATELPDQILLQMHLTFVS